MLSTEACREYLGDIPLSDEQVERLRDSLYALVENVLDNYLDSSANVEPCKKHLSTPECLQSDRRLKVMV